MEQVVLKAQKKDESGKGAARKLRAEGLVPGVIYGLGKETVGFAVQRRELYDLLDKATGGNVLISLDMPDMQIDADTAALIKEIQWSPVHKEALSVDLQWISLKEPVTVSVNITIHGHATGLEEGGSMNQIRYQAEVECLPTDIPEELTMDVTGMQISETRFASDLAVPEGVTLLLDPEEPIATIARPISAADLEVRTDEELPEGELEELALAEEQSEAAAEAAQSTEADGEAEAESDSAE
jgi:large subunit ribosomal protein L25